MAIEKLKKELKENSSNVVPAQQITDYLIKKCKEDKDFSEKVLDENKNLKDCFDFIYKQVKEKLNNKNGWIDDQEVYDIAEEYFTGEKVKKIKIIKKELSEADETTEHKIKEIEAAKNKEINDRDKKIKELEERIKSIQENNKQEALTDVNKKAKKTKKKVNKDKNVQGQISFL